MMPSAAEHDAEHDAESCDYIAHHMLAVFSCSHAYVDFRARNHHFHRRHESRALAASASRWRRARRRPFQVQNVRSSGFLSPIALQAGACANSTPRCRCDASLVTSALANVSHIQMIIFHHAGGAGTRVGRLVGTDCRFGLELVTRVHRCPAPLGIHCTAAAAVARRAARQWCGAYAHRRGERTQRALLTTRRAAARRRGAAGRFKHCKWFPGAA